MSGRNPPAAADVLHRLEAAGVKVSARLRLEPAEGVTLPAGLVAEAKAARFGLLRLLVLGDDCGPLPPAPRGDLPPLFAVLDEHAVGLWAEGEPVADAGPRLLSALRATWPAEVAEPLAERWRARVAEAGARAGFARLFADAVDVTRADLVAPRWRPPEPAEDESSGGG